MAAYGGNNSVVTVLLEQSANPNLQVSISFLPSQHLCSLLTLFHLFLHAPQDGNGVSPVHLAAMEGHVECIETLIAHSAYLNFVDFSEER